MCPVSITGSPGIVMLQQCADLIFVPLGRLMVSGFVEIRLFSTGVPCMMKIAVAPVSIIACDIFCRRSCPGAPKRARAVAVIHCCCTGRLNMVLVLLLWDSTAVVVLDAMTVISLLSTFDCII